MGAEMRDVFFVVMCHVEQPMVIFFLLSYCYSVTDDE